jgi:hypothetical protein
MDQVQKMFQKIPIEEECLNQNSRNIPLLSLGVG